MRITTGSILNINAGVTFIGAGFDGGFSLKFRFQAAAGILTGIEVLRKLGWIKYALNWRRCQSWIKEELIASSCIILDG
jgi:hypothetical protein